ncbi:MAG: glycosyltransferase family 2 protein, partial [Candidatus Ventricola sp.]
MDAPLVSVIVPIYNAAIDLVPCLESIKRQRYQNLEILLVNDGSSDSSLEICRMYARLDPRIIIIDKENSGVSGTRNVAIERATGKYLQFVDADDYLDINATRLMVEAIEEAGADLLVSHYCSVVPGGHIQVFGFLPPDARMDKAQFARHLMEEPASFYYGVMWNKLYRRDLIMDNHIRCNEEFTWSEDMLFNLEYIRYAERFCSLRTPVYYYTRQKKNSLSAKVTPARVLTTKAELFKYYKQLYIDLGLYET